VCIHDLYLSQQIIGNDDENDLALQMANLRAGLSPPQYVILWVFLFVLTFFNSAFVSSTSISANPVVSILVAVRVVTQLPSRSYNQACR
jgi:hypothetical protein